MNQRICCIFNYAPHYRVSIYQLLDKELDCDIYFGDNVHANIKKLDLQTLKNAKELKSLWLFNRIYWIVGSVRLIFMPYKKYLLTGQMNCISNWIILFLAKLLKKEIFIWNHGWYGNETRIQISMRKYFYSFVSGFFLYGEYAKKLMIHQGIDESKLHIVFNSLDYSKALEVRKKLTKTNVYNTKFNYLAPVLLFIGRVQSTKRLELLIAAVKNLKTKGREINLVIIGDGDEKRRLEKLVNTYSLPQNVWFYGQCYEESELGMLIYNADLCVSPGNLGLTAIHSLSYGTPVITHNDFKNQMPEFEAITPGKTGAFFEVNDLRSLEFEIERWLKLNPEKSANIIEDCYKTIDDKYNPDFQIKVFKRILCIKNESTPN